MPNHKGIVPGNAMTTRSRGKPHGVNGTGANVEHAMQQALKAANLSRRAFARKMGYHPSNLDKVAYRKRPALKHIAKWQKELAKHVDVIRFREPAHSTLPT